MLRQLGEAFYEYLTRNDYHPNNADHVAQLRVELEKFKACRDRLLSLDNKIAMAGSVDVVLYFFGAVGPALGTLGAVMLYLYATQYENRPEASKAFQEQLKKMVDLYHWCAKNHSPGLTKQDPNFVAMFDAIAPFIVRKKDLIPWDLDRVNLSDLSDDYVAILERAPHRLSFPGRKASGSSILQDVSSRVQEAATGVVQGQAPSVTRLHEKAKPYLRFFEQSIAEARLAAYGYEPIEPAVTAEAQPAMR